MDLYSDIVGISGASLSLGLGSLDLSYGVNSPATGLTKAKGSIYLQQSGGAAVGLLWLKYGADDTDWTQVANIAPGGVTVSRALTVDGNGRLATGTTTATELAYLTGVTSAIQAQINAKQATLAAGTTTTVLHGNAGGPQSFGPVVEADISLSANATGNATTVRHGFLPVLSGVTTQFLRGDGAYATPAGTASAYLSQSFNSTATIVVTHNFGAFPLVQVIDGSGVVLSPTSITHNSNNQVTVVLPSPDTGNVLATLGSPQLNTLVSSAIDYMTLASDRIVRMTGADKTLTLITAVGRPGYEVKIKNVSSGNLTVIGTSSQTIDGNLSVTLGTLDSITVISNGTNYEII